MKEFFAKLREKTDFRNSDNIINISKGRKILFLVPVIVIILACILGTIYQLVPSIDGFFNAGIDFQGGTILTVTMTGADMLGDNRERNEEIIKNAVNAEHFEISVVQTSGDNAIIVRYKNIAYLPDGSMVNYGSDDLTEELNALNTNICEAIEEAFTNEYSSTEISIKATSAMTSASASSDLIKKACLAVGIALIVILIYIIIRFDFFSGICAIIGLLHDILIMLALTVICRIEMNSEYVAAIITIVAYSINNTIMVFDRVRAISKDNKKSDAVLDPDQIANLAVTQSFTRTILATVTTMIVMICLIIFSVTSVRTFGLPILFGLIGGLFSATCLAPNLWALMKSADNKRKENKLKYSNGQEEKVNHISAFFNNMKDKFATANKAKKKSAKNGKGKRK